eukprot:6180606-Pleurochrysis_carterae.AAC.1
MHSFNTRHTHLSGHLVARVLLVATVSTRRCTAQQEVISAVTLPCAGSVKKLHLYKLNDARNTCVLHSLPIVVSRPSEFCWMRFTAKRPPQVIHDS